MKRSFFQTAVVSILLYGCTTRTLTKRLEKKLDSNYTRMLRAILNKSWRQHPTRHQLYGHLPPITKTIQVRRTRHAGHCWRSKDELISDVLLWTPTYGQAKAGWPARTYIQQLCEDTGCNPEELPEAMNNREKWRERVRDIRAGGTTWWFQTIQFTKSTQFSSIWPTHLGPYWMLPLQAREDLGVIAMKGYFAFPKGSPSDCLVSYPRHSLGESCPSAEIQSVYSTASADWARKAQLITEQ